MKNKQYPLHHDHGTITISRDIFESMTAELERLRPMETGLELAEADRDAYKKRAEELTAEYHKERDEHIDWIRRLQNVIAELNKCGHKTQRTLWIARVQRAEAELKKWNARAHYAICSSDREELCYKFVKAWRNVECKCRKKAKEFE